jgi:cell division protein FtsN
MADNKDDKRGGEHASINDSGELLRSLFREDLDAITAEKRKETAAKTGDRTGVPQTAKSPAQVKGTGRKEVGPETGTEKRKIVKNYPVSEVQAEKPGEVVSNRDRSLKKELKEETAPQIREDTPEGGRPAESIKTKQLKGGKVRFGGNLSVASGKLKVALLSVLLVAAVAFLLSSLGVVDFGQLLGLSEPAKKAGRKTRVGRKPPAKKSTPVAAKSTQKTPNNKASDRASAPKRRRIVSKPSQASLSKERRRVINRRSRPVTSTKKPIIVQEQLDPSASTEKPVIAGQLPKPIASTQKEAVPGQPVESATTAQEPPVSKAPAQPVGPVQESLVAEKPPEPSAPEVQHVTRAASRSAERTPEKAALAKGNVFPGERDLSYPYSIYLGSYKTRERAEKAISEYRNKGLSPYWVELNLGDKGMWYRVFSGYFQKREQANEFIKKKQIAESKSRHTRYANLIGRFAFQKELDEEKLRLSKLGYCPYVIPSRNGESLLYVGAFYQKARAQKQHAELASKGIHSQIVER